MIASAKMSIYYYLVKIVCNLQHYEDESLKIHFSKAYIIPV
jgi:hypothetical protein